MAGGAPKAGGRDADISGLLFELSEAKVNPNKTIAQALKNFDTIVNKTEWTQADVIAIEVNKKIVDSYGELFKRIPSLAGKRSSEVSMADLLGGGHNVRPASLDSERGGAYTKAPRKHSLPETE